MLEMLIALVCLGVGLAGLAALLGGTMGAAGAQGRRMTARWRALAILEGDRGPDPGFRVETADREGRREVRVTWAERPGRSGEVRLQVWHGQD